MTSDRTHEQIDRAFLLADNFCFEIVEGTGVNVDHGDGGIHRAPVTAELHEVHRIADAAPGFQLAVEWLVSRGIATVNGDGSGEYVTLTVPVPAP